MKKFLLILSFVASLLAKAQSYELVTKDTINLTDANGKKQGKWILFGRHQPNSAYEPNQKMSEGMYKDNRKTGVWIDYFPTGNIKNNITFVDGRPHGSCNLYFWDGKIKEEGTWLNNRWVGHYKYTFENGDVLEIVFDDKGKEVTKKMTPGNKSAPSKKK